MKYKLCAKCGTLTRYKNIIELYEVKDMYAIWNCSRCGNQEIISNEELIIRSQVQSKSLSLKS